MMDLKIVVLSLLVVVCSYGLIQGRPVCGKDEYWFKITGNCEPCSNLCPEYKTDCPKYCPDYTPQLSTTTSARLSTTTAAPTSRDSSTIEVWLIIASIAIIGIIIFSVWLNWERIHQIYIRCFSNNTETDQPPFPVQEESPMLGHTERPPLGNTSISDSEGTISIGDSGVEMLGENNSDDVRLTTAEP